MQHDFKSIRGWNWAAFLLTWVWGVPHRVWVSLLALIPVINIIIAIYLGLKGNEIAWRQNRYLSVQEYKDSQRLWLRWSLIVCIATIIFILIFLLGIAYTAHLSDQMALRDSQRISDTRTIISAVNHYKQENDKNCPESLDSLVPKYIKAIPVSPGGERYQYSIKGQDCYISTRLEDALDGNLEDDADVTNGSIFDQKSQDLNNFIFYEE